MGCGATKEEVKPVEKPREVVIPKPVVAPPPSPPPPPPPPPPDPTPVIEAENEEREKVESEWYTLCGALCAAERCGAVDVGERLAWDVLVEVAELDLHGTCQHEDIVSNEEEEWLHLARLCLIGFAECVTRENIAVSELSAGFVTNVVQNACKGTCIWRAKTTETAKLNTQLRYTVLSEELTSTLQTVSSRIESLYFIEALQATEHGETYQRNPISSMEILQREYLFKSAEISLEHLFITTTHSLEHKEEILRTQTIETEASQCWTTLFAELCSREAILRNAHQNDNATWGTMIATQTLARNVISSTLSLSCIAVQSIRHCRSIDSLLNNSFSNKIDLFWTDIASSVTTCLQSHSKLCSIQAGIAKRETITARRFIAQQFFSRNYIPPTRDVISLGGAAWNVNSLPHLQQLDRDAEQRRFGLSLALCSALEVPYLPPAEEMGLMYGALLRIRVKWCMARGRARVRLARRVQMFARVRLSRLLSTKLALERLLGDVCRWKSESLMDNVVMRPGVSSTSAEVVEEVHKALEKDADCRELLVALAALSSVSRAGVTVRQPRRVVNVSVKNSCIAVETCRPDDVAQWSAAMCIQRLCRSRVARLRVRERRVDKIRSLCSPVGLARMYARTLARKINAATLIKRMVLRGRERRLACIRIQQAWRVGLARNAAEARRMILANFIRKIAHQTRLLKQRTLQEFQKGAAAIFRSEARAHADLAQVCLRVKSERVLECVRLAGAKAPILKDLSPLAVASNALQGKCVEMEKERAEAYRHAAEKLDACKGRLRETKGQVFETMVQDGKEHNENLDILDTKVKHIDKMLQVATEALEYSDKRRRKHSFFINPAEVHNRGQRRSFNVAPGTPRLDPMEGSRNMLCPRLSCSTVAFPIRPGSAEIVRNMNSAATTHLSSASQRDAPRMSSASQRRLSIHDPDQSVVLVFMPEHVACINPAQRKRLDIPVKSLSLGKACKPNAVTSAFNNGDTRCASFYSEGKLSLCRLGASRVWEELLSCQWEELWTEVICFELGDSFAAAYYSTESGEFGLAVFADDGTATILKELSRKLVVFGFSRLSHAYVKDDCHYFVLLNASNTDFILLGANAGKGDIFYISAVEPLLPLTEGVVSVTLGTSEGGPMLCVSSFNSLRLIDVSFSDAGDIELEEVFERPGSHTRGVLIPYEDGVDCVVAVRSGGELVVYPITEDTDPMKTEVYHTPVSRAFHLSAHIPGTSGGAVLMKGDIVDSVPQTKRLPAKDPVCAIGVGVAGVRAENGVLEERRTQLRKLRVLQRGLQRQTLGGTMLTQVDVDLGEKGLTDKDLEGCIPALRRNRCLKSLTLRGNLLTDVAMVLLSRVVEFSTRLRRIEYARKIVFFLSIFFNSISLRDNLLTQDGAVQLMGSVKINKHVHTVMLDGNDIDEQILRSVWNMTAQRTTEGEEEEEEAEEEEETSVFKNPPE